MTQTVPVTAPPLPLPLPPTKLPPLPRTSRPPLFRRPFPCGPCVSFVCGTPLFVLLPSNILDSIHQPLPPPLSRSLSESACPYKTSHLIFFSGFIFTIVGFCVSARCSLSPFRMRVYHVVTIHAHSIKPRMTRVSIYRANTHTNTHTLVER